MIELLGNVAVTCAYISLLLYTNSGNYPLLGVPALAQDASAATLTRRGRFQTDVGTNHSLWDGVVVLASWLISTLHYQESYLDRNRPHACPSHGASVSALPEKERCVGRF